MPYIAAGLYRAVVEDHEWCYSSKGTKAICVRFRVVDGDEENTLVHINWYGYFSEKTWERTVESLRHMGFKGDDLNNLGELDETVQLDVVQEEYDGKVHAKVKWVNSLRASKIQVQNKMMDNDVAAFAKAMQERISAMGRKNGEVRRSAPQRDEIPF